jgi:hypothetical protein
LEFAGVCSLEFVLEVISVVKGVIALEFVDIIDEFDEG